LVVFFFRQAEDKENQGVLRVPEILGFANSTPMAGVLPWTINLFHSSRSLEQNGFCLVTSFRPVFPTTKAVRKLPTLHRSSHIIPGSFLVMALWPIDPYKKSPA